MWTDDPWARAQLSDENSRSLRALADEWSEIARALSALCIEINAGNWDSDAARRADERAGELTRAARDFETQMWTIAT